MDIGPIYIPAVLKLQGNSFTISHGHPACSCAYKYTTSGTATCFTLQFFSHLRTLHSNEDLFSRLKFEILATVALLFLFGN